MIFKNTIKSLGPGLLWAGAAIGVSHLVQSTRAGAIYGFHSNIFWLNYLIFECYIFLFVFNGICCLTRLFIFKVFSEPSCFIHILVV